MKTLFSLLSLLSFYPLRFTACFECPRGCLNRKFSESRYAISTASSDIQSHDTCKSSYVSAVQRHSFHEFSLHLQFEKVGTYATYISFFAGTCTCSLLVRYITYILYIYSPSLSILHRSCRKIFAIFLPTIPYLSIQKTFMVWHICSLKNNRLKNECKTMNKDS